VAIPVIRHEDPGEARMPFEQDSEEIPGLSFMPVHVRIDRHERVDDWVILTHSDLKA
jgi:hypothetical protein